MRHTEFTVDGAVRAADSTPPERVRRRHSSPAVWRLAALALALTAAGCTVTEQSEQERHFTRGRGVLGSVQRWAMQLQGLQTAFAAERLTAAPVDMVVIEPMRSARSSADFPMQRLVQRLQDAPGFAMPRKLCIAYLNIGQAEDYRSYWQPDWRAPDTDKTGQPDFLICADPDGWQGNYPVAFWNELWQRTLFGSPDAPLDQILADGFDGVYLDWVLGYAQPEVVRAAGAAGLDPAAAMVALLERLRAYARERRPGFLLIAQNGAALPERQPRFFEVIDGFAQEDLSFHGEATATWDAPTSGDLPAPSTGEWATAELAARLQRFTARGVPVFTMDYARRAPAIEQAEQTSRKFGFVPFVSRTPLDRLPQHLFEAGAAAPARAR